MIIRLGQCEPQERLNFHICACCRMRMIEQGRSSVIQAPNQLSSGDKIRCHSEPRFPQLDIQPLPKELDGD